METKKFSKGEAIRFGWEVMKKNFWFFVGVLLVIGIISSVPSNLAEALKEKTPSLAVILILAGFVLTLAVNLGIMKITLKFADNKKRRFEDLFSCFPLFFKFLVALILYNLMILVGTILLVIPGIIWAIKYQFFGYLIIDKGSGPIEALKRSGEITRGAKWNLFVFSLMISGINLIGFLCLIVGLFATIPVTIVATAFIYRKLSAQLLPEVVQGFTNEPQPKITNSQGEKF